jgi:hypothetical protein
MCGRRKSLRFEDVWQRKIAEASAAGTMEVLKEIRTVREFAMEEEEADKFGANNAYRAQIEEYGSAIFHILFISPLVKILSVSPFKRRMFCTYLYACVHARE